MTVGEMYAWTNRLNNILTVGGPLRNERLNNLLNDLYIATDLANDKFAMSLYITVKEALEEVS